MRPEQRAKVLADRYKAAAKKSCGATIEMAETIVKAVHELKGRPLAMFYDAIGLNPNGSTRSKLIKIGRTSARFRRHLDRLPNAWTTLYELAQLKSDQFERLLASEALHPMATWEELKKVLGRRGKNDSENGRDRVSLPFRFNLSKLPASRRQQFIERLMALCHDFKVPWTPSKSSQATIKSLVNHVHPIPFGKAAAEQASSAAI